MKTIFFLIAIPTLCKSIPIKSTTFQPFSTTSRNLYVLSALDHHEEVPLNGIEIKADKKHTNIADDHVFQKKIVALPLSKVEPNTQVLTNEDGHAIVAHGTDSSDEDMNMAESSIVFRPLFTYRRQQQQRKRFYVPSRHCHDETTLSPNYVPNCNRRDYFIEANVLSGYNRPYRDTIKESYPEWYQKAEFPALI